jgi:hypothetical protein
MTPRQLKQAAARQPVEARVIADGCRDYVVQVVWSDGGGLLRHLRGEALHFQNLGDVRRLLGRCGVRSAVLRQRVADDEACAGDGRNAFHDLPITVRH